MKFEQNYKTCLYPGMSGHIYLCFMSPCLGLLYIWAYADDGWLISSILNIYFFLFYAWSINESSIVNHTAMHTYVFNQCTFPSHWLRGRDLLCTFSLSLFRHNCCVFCYCLLGNWLYYASYGDMLVICCLNVLD